MAPKEAGPELQEPVDVTLYGKRNFAGVIKSSSFRRALNVITSSYKRGGGRLDTGDAPVANPVATGN